jgi:hypothetical protein
MLVTETGWYGMYYNTLADGTYSDAQFMLLATEEEGQEVAEHVSGVQATSNPVFARAGQTLSDTGCCLTVV